MPQRVVLLLAVIGRDETLDVMTELNIHVVNHPTHGYLLSAGDDVVLVKHKYHALGRYIQEVAL